ncbi:M1 family metallopeptidase [Companilactobacillus sp. DQM5]|uniref:M1 family metallopeptidase n=1 Tax=Companilactobacillus sp. DQM5 TaxID=3463359 RepID=UPI0040592A48
MTEVKHFFEYFKPETYNIFLDINRKNKTIKGETEINGEARDSTIFLNQKNLKIESITSNGNSLDFSVNNEDDSITISLNKTGLTNLKIKYHADLTDTMMGIYPSYYEVDGEQKQLVGTQFETTFARQAFPSIDEPEAKAKFNLAIKFDEQPGETILSNMPEIKNENGIHYFDTTVRMSTYLVAFAFGDLQSVKTKTKNGTQIGVFSTKAHKLSELDFSLDIAKRAIEFYEDFYQTPYPLPHSWQLALPDFSAGAMENWGLVTYREAYLLVDPRNTSIETKQRVATVVAHELAHQWFGDLVTMKWWEDLWLNESFANMMEYLSIDAIEPSWNIWESFQTGEVARALKRDATDGVQSVHVKVEDPAEIDALFDGAIVYAKGSRILVMVRSLIGDEALRSGLKDYFKNHSYGNAQGDDLWNALSKYSKLDITKIMHSWLEQPGYPVVSASVVNGDLILKQKQFFIGEGKEVGRKWEIPLNTNYKNTPLIMSQEELNLGRYKELREQNNQPFRLNVGNSSHFVVKYDDALLEDIFKDIDSLDNISQLQILQDLRLLAESNQISYANVVGYLKHFSNSKSAIVNTGLYVLANNLKKFVDNDSDEERNLKKLFNKLSADIVNDLTAENRENDSLDDTLSRPVVVNAAMYGENIAVEKQLHDIFELNKDSLEKLPAATRMLIMKNEVQNFGNDSLYEKLFKEYQNTTSPSYKADLVRAITSAESKNFLQKVVGEFENSQIIKPQDLRAWFQGVLENGIGEQLAWDWIRNDWDWLEKTVGGDMEFATFITVISTVLNNRQRLNEFKKFFEPKLQTPGLTREIIMDTKVIETRVKLVEEEKNTVNQAISDEM